MIKAYIDYGFDDIRTFFNLNELKPTGRWKIKHITPFAKKLYIEHQGWFFKKWIEDRKIYFQEENLEKEVIFECNYREKT